jgi:predicted nucleic acid-binding protein
MQTVLVDTNCLIDLAEDRQPRAADLRRIVAGQVPEYEVVVSAITASENPKRGSAPKTWTSS